MKEYDVAIIGAGPAGSTTARFAAEKGLSVIMLDKRRTIGVPVQCGEFLPAITEIRKLFPRVPEPEVLFDVKPVLVQRLTSVLKLILPRKNIIRLKFEGFSIDRARFDQWLAQNAVEAGAVLKTGTRVMKLIKNRLITNNGEFRGRIIVGADGPFSIIARYACLKPRAPPIPAITCQAEGEFEPELEMYFGNLAPGGYAWVIPKKGCANVGLGVQWLREPLIHLLFRFLEYRGIKRKKIRHLAIGFVPISGPLPQTVRNNILLVGDAAGQVMASNGGGIPGALVCGRVAGNVIASHLTDGVPLENYEHAWRALIGPELETARRTKQLADFCMWNDWILDFMMRMLGEKRLGRAIRCQPLFRISRFYRRFAISPEQP